MNSHEDIPSTKYMAILIIYNINMIDKYELVWTWKNI